MSKTKNKEKNELEHQRGLVRKLKSENRQLRKRLAKLDKRAHFFQEIEEEAEEIELSDVCKECSTGIMISIDLKFVRYKVCSECKHREKI